MRKPTFCICENKDEDQLCGIRTADQRLCFRYTDSTIPLLPESENLSLYPSSVAVQPGLCGTWSETPKTGFLITRLISSRTMKKTTMCLICSWKTDHDGHPPTLIRVITTKYLTSLLFFTWTAKPLIRLFGYPGCPNAAHSSNFTVLSIRMGVYITRCKRWL